MMNNREKQIIKILRSSPLIQENEIADILKISRSRVAAHIMDLMRKGAIKGRGYTHGHLSLNPALREQLMKVSASSIDHWLKDEPQLCSTELLLKLEDAHSGKFTEGHR